jgi:hypothetical protein
MPLHQYIAILLCTLFYLPCLQIDVEAKCPIYGNANNHIQSPIINKFIENIKMINPGRMLLLKAITPIYYLSSPFFILSSLFQNRSERQLSNLW